MDPTDSHEIKGSHTWTLNPDEVLRNPIHYRWAPQHLTRTATGISFIQLPSGKATWAPHYLTHRQDPPTVNPLKDYLYMEADPDEETNTWKCRAWWSQHPKYSHPDDYLLALTILAATTPPTDTHISIGPLETETPRMGTRLDRTQHGETIITHLHDPPPILAIRHHAATLQPQRMGQEQRKLVPRPNNPNSRRLTLQQSH